MQTFLCSIALSIALLTTNLLTAQTCPISVALPADTVLCAPGSIPLTAQISGGPVLDQRWEPTTGLSDPSVLNPVATVAADVTYRFIARAVSTDELVVNGDFSAGNTGFLSDYQNHTGTTNLPDTHYAIATTPRQVHRSFANCDDHTTGSGQMMVINADEQISRVWCQTITVSPQTEYVFNAWIASAVSQNPAQLRLRIANQDVGGIFMAASTTCTWRNLTQTWTSGTATQVEVCLVNANLTAVGNDYALDDISLRPICEVSDSIRLSLADDLVAEFPAPAPYCSQDTTIDVDGLLPATTTAGGSWDIDGQPITAFNPDALGEGTFDLRYTVRDGNCELSHTETLTIVDAPTAGQSLPAPTLCDGEAAQFDLNTLLTGADANGSWAAATSLPAGALDAATGLVNLANIPAGSDYVFTYTVDGPANCTPDVAQVRIVLAPAVTPELGEALTLDCFEPESVLTSGLPNNANLRFDWTRDGQRLTGADAQIRVTEGGTYALTVTDIVSGCSGIDTVTVISQVQRLEATLQVTEISCESPNSGAIAVAVQQATTPPYVYQLNGAGFQTAADFSQLTEGAYELIVQDAAGCEDTLQATLTNPANWKLDVVSDGSPVIGLGESIGLRVLTSLPASEIASIEWTPDPPGCMGCNQVVVQPDSSTKYRVTVTSVNGCARTDSVRVLLFIGRIVYIPNIFSPNDDGNNDRFTVFGGVGVININTLRIFDRWGNIIFEGQDLTPNAVGEGWDGTTRGQPAPPGTYIYQTEITLFDQQTFSLEGEVSLIR